MKITQKIFGAVICLSFTALCFAETLSPAFQALVREGEQLDRDLAAWNARCSTHNLTVSEYNQCAQQQSTLLARKQNIFSRAQALKQAESAQHHSQTAASTSNLETAHKQAGKAFDEGGGPGSPTVVDARGVNSQRDQISAVPPKYKNNPEIMRYDTQAREAAAKASKLQQDITKLEQERNSSSNRGAVDVKIANARNELSVAKSTE